VSQKTQSKSFFYYDFVKFSATLIIYGTKMAKTIKLCKVHSFSTSPNLCQCTSLPCETEIHQIVTLRGDYLYLTAQLCIINSTKGI